MKKSIKCYLCIWCQQCNEEQEAKCAKLNYGLFATEDDKKMCDMLCGEPQKDED